MLNDEGGELLMVDKNRIEGTAKEAVGKVEDAAGGLLGDPETQAAGKINQAVGNLQSTYGKVSDEIRDAAGSVIEATSEQPVIALLITLTVGFLLGRMSVTAMR
jgi:uncharacterized protein YjbJ (UPF0337 family)